ncbi:MAG TPA: YdcH family protein [Candidatus Aminicenantes bacterium]|nr:YdcH family protein [Candidatus Aminicenantes bacterium]
MEDRRIKEILLEKNPQFRKLFLEHHDFEERLAVLLQKKDKTDLEQIEELEIKKRKLALKDQMQKQICTFRAGID